MNPTPRPASLFRDAPLLAVTIVMIAIMGLGLVGGGAWLAMLGGSAYYLVAGIMLLLTAWLLIRRRAEALWIYAALLLGTMAWAIWEAGFDFWSLAPRGDILAPLGVWLLLPFIARRLAPNLRAARWALGFVLIVAAGVLGLSLARDRHDLAGTIAESKMTGAIASADGVPPIAGENWTAYGGSSFGTRYSSLSQITTANAGDLKLAWEFRTGDHKGADDPDEITNQATPLKIGDLLYICSPHQIVFALDAKTGQLRWKFDPQVQHNKAFQHMTCRGVSYHATKEGSVTAYGTPAPGDCPERIFVPTNDGRMFALDARSGTPCVSFGDKGQIDLKEEARSRRSVSTKAPRRPW
ncbi:PQQ enzyme-like repeat protein [Bradyrhizobium sp. R2.2-H]|jgi:quinoprotein glucose dehydrogenase|nr:PQQ enzyme-like repeat protein [Bradyrhizobium sp. Y-H1]TCU67693.1 PQQ enzyme-like repeat protein [Bradyrhizobium sp. R2.2-H]